MPINRMPAASCTSPAETRSNNSSRHTLLKSHIPWTHAGGGTLDLLMTNVPDLVRVGDSIGNSIHSSLLAVISMAHAVPNLCIGRKVSVTDTVI